MDRWPPLAPANLALELRRKTQQEIFAARGGDELDSDRKTLAIPMHREGDRGLAGDVERYAKGEDRGATRKGVQWFGRVGHELADPRLFPVSTSWTV